MIAIPPLPAPTPSPADDLAFAAQEAGDLRAAFLHWRIAVAQGHLGSLMNLGYCHDEGLGTPRSKHAAMRCYLRAARAGCGGCASNVAILFRERQHFRAMFRWFRRAADLGDGCSLVDLAKCHRDGRGTPRSRSRAIAHARQAARSTHISEASREEAGEILGALRLASSSARITDVRERRRAATTSFAHPSGPPRTA